MLVTLGKQRVEILEEQLFMTSCLLTAAQIIKDS